MRRIVLTALAILAIGGCATAGGGSTAPDVTEATGTPGPSPTASPVPSTVATAPSPTTTPSFAKVFASPVYGYTIGIDPAWTAKTATVPADDPTSTDETATDVITVSGTDTAISGIAWSLGTETFKTWLEDYRESTAAGVPAGCDGGDPATWPPVAIGTLQGVWQQKCNAAVASIEAGGTVYQFAWEHSTFDGDQHLPVADFKAMLKTVTLPDPVASASPTS